MKRKAFLIKHTYFEDRRIVKCVGGDADFSDPGMRKPTHVTISGSEKANQVMMILLMRNVALRLPA